MGKRLTVASISAVGVLMERDLKVRVVNCGRAWPWAAVRTSTTLFFLSDFTTVQLALRPLDNRGEHAPSRSSEIVGGHGSIWYGLVVIGHFGRGRWCLSREVVGLRKE